MRKTQALILMVLLFNCLLNTMVVRAEESNNQGLQTEMVAPENTQNTNPYCIMSEEEFEFACKIVIGEAGNQDFMGKVLVLNCSINNAKELGISLMEEFTMKGRYSSVKNGNVYLMYTNADGKYVEEIVTADMITDEIKQAVETACSNDFTEELLKAAADQQGCSDEQYYVGGARFFYNPDAISKNRKAERENITLSFEYGDHVFYRVWD